VYANAGGGSFAPIGGITEEHFDQTFDTNVKGTLFTVQKALPFMPKPSMTFLIKKWKRAVIYGDRGKKVTCAATGLRSRLPV
jgi:NAD(P)-dependent dehydrogenase (short-subunit alcohol dehydrogenase family)